VELGRLLRLAGIARDSTHVWLDGADHGWFKPGTPAARHVAEYRKDLPLATALDPEVLVAYEMNGERLPAEHGFPLRAMVPGHYGTNSVKWLKRITVATARPNHLFASELYNVRKIVDGKAELIQVADMDVNCRIIAPTDGARTSLRKQRVLGWAWGAHEVAGVDVSLDDGATWSPSDLEPRCDRGWQQFSVSWQPSRPGVTHLTARARDTAGDVQPMNAAINQVHRVTVHVADLP
jgi:DMSO/TMAO reductase YedYZ molybdopterin-dependent catalytic subunit